jgi:hypothetical protein
MRSAWVGSVLVVATAVSSVACMGSDGPVVPYDPFDAGPPDAARSTDCREPPSWVPAPPADCPAFVEFCGVGDLDMKAWCRDRQVFAVAPVTFAWCYCGTSDQACQGVKGDNPPPIFTCPGACLTEEPHYFDSYQEFNEFAPETLCEWPDAGVADAAP